MPEALVVRCPNCGLPAAQGDKECEACGSPITVPSMSMLGGMGTLQLNKMEHGFNDVLNNPDAKDKASAHMSLGFIYMKLGLYEKADNHFDQAIDACVENPDLFYTAAISLLGGKKAYLCPRDKIEKAERYLQIAIELEPRGVFYYFWAYIRYDFYSRRFYSCKPTYQEILRDARANGVNGQDVRDLFELLKVDIPSAIQ